MVGVPVGVGTRDLATPEAKRGIMLTAMLPILLLISAFLGGIHLAMDTTAGERERQSLEPLLATPAARGAIVSAKMLAAVVIGIASLLLLSLIHISTTWPDWCACMPTCRRSARCCRS